MKDAEDEAFDELTRKQGSWGGGYQAKRAMAADKLQDESDMLTIAYLDGYERGKKAALAQPAQGPFGWYSAQEDEFMPHKIRKEHERLNSYTHINGKFDLPLYTAAAQPAQEPVAREWNFCERCGKRTRDMTTMHTCTPPQEGK